MHPAYPWLLAAAVVVAAAIVATPLFLLQPFSPQSDADLTVAYALSRWQVALTLTISLFGAACLFGYWRRPRPPGRVGKSLGLLALALLLGSTLIARQNLYEWAFRPVEALAFGLIADTDHLDDANMVLGLQVGGEAKAYPVGMLSYHHLVNDELGGEPFVATY